MTQRRQRSRWRWATVAGVLAALVTVSGCTVDGDATRAAEPGGPAASSPAGSPSPGAGASGSSASGSSAAGSSAAPSSSGAPSAQPASPPSSAASPGPSTPADNEPAGGGLAAKAWTMTCSDYRKLTPDEQKEITVELGRRLNKKQLRENERSWAIVNEFCKDGLVRNSPGVRDSE